MAAVRTIICGSPQPEGKCNSLAGHLRDALQLLFPQDEIRLFNVAHLHVDPCVGCNVCSDGGGCFMCDGMSEIHEALQDSVAVYVVSPIYFAGPPSQLKALLDRMQPLYFSCDRSCEKRPAYLVAVGAGGDPHGYAPLETILRSSLAVAGYRLDEVLACVEEPIEESISRIDEMAMRIACNDESTEREVQ